MSSHAGSDRSAQPMKGRMEYALFWKVDTASNADSVTACLVIVVALLASLYLAFLIDIPAAESLLQLPL